jgi:hypothetical protein
MAATAWSSGSGGEVGLVISWKGGDPRRDSEFGESGNVKGVITVYAIV